MQIHVLIPTLERIVEAACRSNANRFGYGIWTHHIVPVVGYGRWLAPQLGADADVVTIAALLHDYANIVQPTANDDDHHERGAQVAACLLRSLGYPAASTALVAQCIVQHRGSVPVPRTTPEAVCLASADAMAHIDQVPSLLALAYVQFGMEIDAGMAWVRAKLERSWHKLCPLAQDHMYDSYRAALRVLSAPSRPLAFVVAEAAVVG
jgi:hypothetical protein